MDKKANDTFAFDLENRLDDFFSDAIPSHEEAPADESQSPESDSPLKDLKSTILAIDWEITDEALEAFIHQIDRLGEQFEDDKASHTLLKLLKSLGKYIRSHKSKAHPDSIKRIMSVYSTLEEIVNNDELRPDIKEKMVLEEVRQFQRLKAKIVESKSPVSTSDVREAIPAVETNVMGEVLQAIQDLKSMIAGELAAIRAELKKIKR